MQKVSRVVRLFPGQGSQYVGMTKDLVETWPDIGKPMLEELDECFQERISAIMHFGSEIELRQTRVCQAAIFIHSCLVSKILSQYSEVKSNEIVLGHSVGEYAALRSAGVFDFPTGLRLVRERGALMQGLQERPGTRRFTDMG